MLTTDCGTVVALNGGFIRDLIALHGVFSNLLCLLLSLYIDLNIAIVASFQSASHCAKLCAALSASRPAVAPSGRSG